jgi:hypothetical protein
LTLKRSGRQLFPTPQVFLPFNSPEALAHEDGIWSLAFGGAC